MENLNQGHKCFIDELQRHGHFVCHGFLNCYIVPKTVVYAVLNKSS